MRGSDLRKSTLLMLNLIQKEFEMPDECSKILTKSIHKNNRDAHDFRNQRGLFLTSILSKILEKVYYNRNYLKTVNNIRPKKETLLTIYSFYRQQLTIIGTLGQISTSFWPMQKSASTNWTYKAV